MIKKGDFVNILWDGGIRAEFNVKVLYAPYTTGNCWHLLREDGTIVYVQSFSKMEKVNKN